MSRPNIKKEVRIGLFIIIIFIVIFGGWSLFAPLESAAIAPGKVIVAGNHKVVQHLEGGIIEQINIKDGAQVKKGQTLLVLDETKAKSDYVIVQQKLMSNKAAEIRIEAELKGKPLHLSDHFSEKIKSIQKTVYDNNIKKNKDETLIQNQRIEQLKDQLDGYDYSLKANKQQLALINKELVDVKALFEKRLVKQSRLLGLQREQSNLLGKQGEIKSQIAGIHEKISETQIQVNAVNNAYHKELLNELREVRKQIADLSESSKILKESYQRTQIKAPISGKVVRLTAHTVGQVIKPGETILDVVPSNANYKIEAKINTLDIDVLHKGMVAKVVLKSFKQRSTPMLLGTVENVSADAITDPNTGQTYYLATITLDSGELKKLNGEALYPGMPADAMIIVNKITPFQYFIAPISDSFRHAFREQ